MDVLLPAKSAASYSPGPCAYSLAPAIGKGPRFSMSSRYVCAGHVPTNDNPGPNSYDPRLATSAPRISMGAGYANIAKTFDKEEKQKPGPGQYTPRTDRFLSIGRIGTKLGGRPKDFYTVKEMDDLPGPGDYKIPAKSSSCAITFKGRPFYTLNGDQKVPGPGSYTPKFQKEINNSKQIAVHLKSRTKLPNEGESCTPGPGAYAVKSSNTRQAASFGARPVLWQEDKLFTPGPGTYDMQDRAMSAKNISIRGSRPLEVPSNNNPGPGYYETQRQNNSENNKQAFKIAERPALSMAQFRKFKDVPGPGTYETKSKSVGRNISISTKFAPSLLEKPVVPGPGHYQLKPESAAQNIRIGVKQNFEKKNENPGPGAYAANYDFSKPRGHATTIGEKMAAMQAPAARPGPGEYKIPDTIQRVYKRPQRFQ